MLIVCIVAIVGMTIFMMDQATQDSSQLTDNGISGNIIFNVGLKIPSIGSFSRIFFMMTMIGVASYMYLKED